MKPEMIQKIDAVLDRVKDPESNLPVAQLGMVNRIRYNENRQTLYIFSEIQTHIPRCATCAAIASNIAFTIIRDLEKELQAEFPDLSIEFI